MVFLCLFIFICFSCSSGGDSGGGVVARVNKKTLTKKQLSALAGSTMSDAQVLLSTTNRWVEKTLLYNAAVSSGLKKDSDIISKRDRFYEDLLISSFLDMQTKNKINITKKETVDYYTKNKKSFTRPDDEVLIKHFVLPNKKESIRLKKLLMRGGGGEEYEKYVEKYNPQTRSLYKRVAEGSAVGFVFSGSAGGVVGPKEASGFFHLFEILQKHKKGSEKGLDLVYDEIFERLHKQKRENLVVSIIDSLYLSSSVYISPEVR